MHHKYRKGKKKKKTKQFAFKLLRGIKMISGNLLSAQRIWNSLQFALPGYYVTYSSGKLLLCLYDWLSFMHRPSPFSSPTLSMCRCFFLVFSDSAFIVSYCLCFISLHSLIACSGFNRIALPLIFPLLFLFLYFFMYFPPFCFFFVLPQALPIYFACSPLPN